MSSIPLVFSYVLAFLPLRLWPLDLLLHAQICARFLLVVLASSVLAVAFVIGVAGWCADWGWRRVVWVAVVVLVTIVVCQHCWASSMLLSVLVPVAAVASVHALYLLAYTFGPSLIHRSRRPS